MLTARPWYIYRETRVRIIPFPDCRPPSDFLLFQRWVREEMFKHIILPEKLIKPRLTSTEREMILLIVTYN